MGVTLNKILSDGMNMATSGSNPIDYRIEDSQFEYWIHQTRATLAAQDIKKRKDISDVLIQYISCLNLIEVDKSECCEIETNCKILRTELQIPSTIEVNASNMIIRVTKPNGDIISKINEFQSKYDKYNKYANNKTKYYHKNRYIYIFNSSQEELIEKITVAGIFDDPTEVAQYNSCNGSTCYDIYRDDYPCSMEMASNIINIILKTKVYPYIQLPRDTTNDNSDNFNTQVPNNLK